MIGGITSSSISEISNGSAEIKETKSPNVDNFKKIKPEEGTTVKGAENFWKQEFSKKIDAIDVSKTSLENKESDEKQVPSSNIETLQNECIKEAEKTPDLNELDSQAKGNYAEMKVDRDLAGKGYERISKECVTDLITNTGPGIDGVFVKKDTGETFIVEVKFNRSELGDTLDGKQMSSSWIDNRLDAAVGKDTADKIRMDSILNPDNVKSVLAKVDLNGDISYSQLDGGGNYIGGIKL